MNYLLITILFSVGLFVSSCGNLPKVLTSPEFKTSSLEKLESLSRDYYLQSIQNKNLNQAKQLAQLGFSASDRCLTFQKNQKECLYFRALNLGRYYQIHIFGYQDGLKQMIQDLTKVNTLDDHYDAAGAYRTLGVIYAKAPSFSPFKKSITQDLDLSQNYLQKAVQFSPEYALNHLFLAQTYEQLENHFGTRQELLLFQKLKNPQELNIHYPDWQRDEENLIKKLKIR